MLLLLLLMLLLVAVSKTALSHHSVWRQSRVLLLALLMEVMVVLLLLLSMVVVVRGRRVLPIAHHRVSVRQVNVVITARYSPTLLLVLLLGRAQVVENIRSERALESTPG